MFPEEGEIVRGKVEKIIGTSVFVNLLDYNIEGVMNFSEVSPGRIRNIRDYVKIGQIIICKVLRVDTEKKHVDLSLRRVTLKEKQEAKKRWEFEKQVFSIIERIAGKKGKELLKKISEKEDLYDLLFFKIFSMEKEDAIKKLVFFGFNKEEATNFFEILKEKFKEKNVILKKKFQLVCYLPDGVERIKNILKKIDKKIIVVGIPIYEVIIETTNPKEGNKKLQKILEKIEGEAKIQGVQYSPIEK